MNGYIYYLIQVIPAFSVLGLMFFMLGLIVGWLFWHHYRNEAREADAETKRLTMVRESLEKEYAQMKSH